MYTLVFVFPPETQANVECELKFNLIDVDPATGEHESEGFEELFPLEPVSVTTADFLAKVWPSLFPKKHINKE
jgi:hypothetical protein